MDDDEVEVGVMDVRQLGGMEEEAELAVEEEDDDLVAREGRRMGGQELRALARE